MDQESPSTTGPASPSPADELGPPAALPQEPPDERITRSAEPFEATSAALAAPGPAESGLADSAEPAVPNASAIQVEIADAGFAAPTDAPAPDSEPIAPATEPELALAEAHQPATVALATDEAYATEVTTSWHDAGAPSPGTVELGSEPTDFETAEFRQGASEAVSAGADHAVTEPFPDTDTAPQDTSPNWMLAFVCAWSGGTALYELFDALRRTDLAQMPATRLLAVSGYSTLALGLFLAALEALVWGKLSGKRGAQAALLLIPFLLLLAGVACLFMFHDPDPTRGRI